MYSNFFLLPRTYSLKNALQLFFFNLLPGVEVEAKRARKDHRVLWKFDSNRCELSFDFAFNTTRKHRTCGTIVIDLLNCCRPNNAVSTPSKRTLKIEMLIHSTPRGCDSLLDIKAPTFPLDGSTTLRMRLANVDFPAPVRPTRPTCIKNSLIFTLRSTMN